MRVLLALGAIGIAGNLVLGAYDVILADFRWNRWSNLGFATWVAAWFGLFIAPALWHPIVRVTDTEIQLRSVGSREPRRISIGEVVGLRWQDSYDLRLRTRSGSEHSIHLAMAFRQERAGVAAAIAERIGVPAPTV